MHKFAFRRSTVKRFVGGATAVCGAAVFVTGMVTGGPLVNAAVGALIGGSAAIGAIVGVEVANQVTKSIWD